MEREGDISASLAVKSFDYDGLAFNLLDTLGHQDFCWDTYRTLTAMDGVAPNVSDKTFVSRIIIQNPAACGRVCAAVTAGQRPPKGSTRLQIASTRFPARAGHCAKDVRNIVPRLVLNRRLCTARQCHHSPSYAASAQRTVCRRCGVTRTRMTAQVLKSIDEHRDWPLRSFRIRTPARES
jgi:hypothetical protein